MIGQTISHYKILEKLGEGGMGVVYKAEDTRLGRIVALKFPPADRFESTEKVERFNREARMVSALNDPHIATVYELAEADGIKYIAFEYVPGGTLKTFAKEIHDTGRNLRLEKVVDLGIQIADGLAHAHDNGIVHRDLKPDNLLLTDKEQIKITDFGLAKLKGSPQLTKSGSTLGTIAYMSPEQVRGEELDARSDLFSLGVILYQLATGQPPFRGEHEAAISYSILNEDPVSIKTLRSDLSDELAGVIMRCLEKDKDKRFTSAKELTDALRTLYPRKALGEKTTQRGSRRAMWAALGLFAAIAVATVAVIQLVPRQSSEPTGKLWIAVLPFENLSADPDNEYFSDGLTDDIITQLSKITDLSVISRTSTMRYKNIDKNLREIGQELNVDAILEGSVRRVGTQVRITGQLIDARLDEHLWADTYDRELKDIFKIQSDVAEKIARALEVSLTREEKGRIHTEPTQHIAAYDAYLRGREYYYRYRKEDNENAIVLFKKALKIDPQYALALAGLADAYAQRVTRFGFAEAWLDSANVVAQKALELNPELAEAHKASSLVYMMKERYGEALDAVTKALEYNPNFVPAVGNRGWLLVYTGRADEAVIWFEKAKKLVGEGDQQVLHLGGLGLSYLLLDDLEMARHYFDRADEIKPYSTMSIIGRVWLYFAEQRLDKLREELRDATIVIGEDYSLLSHWLGMADIMEGNLSDSKMHLTKAIELNDGAYPPFVGTQESRVAMAYVLWQLDNVDAANDLLDEASDVLKEAINKGREATYLYYRLAQIHCVRGDRSGTLQWLRKAFDSGLIVVRLVEVDPLLENLRDDPQFKKMMDDLRARIAGMRERLKN